jgi:hypothetical protein
MLLKEVRQEDENKNSKLLLKLLVEEETVIISLKCRWSKEPVNIDLESIINPYLKPKEALILKKIINLVYRRKAREGSRAA